MRAQPSTYVLISIMLRDEFNTWRLFSSNLVVVRRSSSQWNIRRATTAADGAMQSMVEVTVSITIDVIANVTCTNRPSRHRGITVRSEYPYPYLRRTRDANCTPVLTLSKKFV